MILAILAASLIPAIFIAAATILILYALDNLAKRMEHLADEHTKRENELMATVQDVSDKLDAATAKVAEIGGQAEEIAQALRDLKAGTVTPEQLDALAAKADAIVSSAQGAIDATKDVDPTP